MFVHAQQRRLKGRLSFIDGTLICLGVIIFCTSLASLVAGYKGRPAARTRTELSTFSFEETDFPDYYPIDLGPATLTPENTIHYQVYSADAALEWDSIFPAGGGFLQLGVGESKNKRYFGLSMFHQLHCLRRIRQAMQTRESTEHVHHCFNYLRQMILCDANPTIEPVIPIMGRKSVNAEIPRVCRDWEGVYRLAERNHRLSLGNQTSGSTRFGFSLPGRRDGRAEEQPQYGI